MDARQKRNERGPQCRGLRFLFGGDRGRTAGLRQCHGDRRLDRALQPAGPIIISKGQPTGGTIISIKAFKGEAEQRQGVGALSVSDQSLAQCRLDVELAVRFPDAARRSLDDALEFAGGDRW